MSQALLRAFVLNNIQAEISSLTTLTKELQALQLAEELRDALNKKPDGSGIESKSKRKPKPKVKI